MKKAFKPALFVLLMCGVFGVDEVKAVSVMEGDSVTLNPDLTQIQGFNRIEWRLEDQLIASFDRSKTKYPYERFGDRLKLNQTGSLTITNMKTNHSGLYKLQIELNSGPVLVYFTVTVYESPPVIDAGKAEMKSVSVKEGDRVTLQTGVTQISGEELIVWRFGDEGKLIAKADKEAKSSPLYYDERFRDRLELDQTGSLIITDTRSTDSGLYTVKISSNKQTLHKRFTVSVIVTVTVSERGLSSGDVAGIVLLVLAAAAAVGFIYYRRKISELQKQTSTVKEGEDVILKPNKEIQKGDVIQWMFGEEEKRTSIAKLIGETGEIVTHDYAAGGRFKGTLKLDTTGSLTIRNSRTAHSGLYTLYITSSSGDSQQRFIITVNVTVPVTVTKGEDVILKPNKEIQKGDVMLWMFGEEEKRTSIAKFTRETGEFVTHDYAADGRFRGRLYLDETTGSLIIRNSRTTHSGLYTLDITSSSGDSEQTFIIIVSETLEEKSVEEGGSVTLKPYNGIQRDDQILWIFGDQYVLIAQIRGETGEICDDVLEGRFRGRLKLEKKNGSLTIRNITAADTGLYELQISSSRRILFKRFRVSIPLERVSVTAGDSVHLSTDRPKIERDDVIEWMFREEIIAEIKEGTGKTHDGPDGRFRDRLQLDDQTGDLTIKNCTDKHEGYYKLKISSSKVNRNKNYMVIITDKPREKSPVKGNNGRYMYVTAGNSVRLFTDRPKIERDDVIEWMFRDEIIAEIKEGTGKTHDDPDERFRDRLQLNVQTGDLTIKNSTIEDAGCYNLKIRSRKGDTNWTYRVIIPWRRVYVTEGESVHLSTGRPEIERGDVIEWRCGDEIIAEIKEGTGKTHDGADDERFRDRLQLDDQTGDLTIKNSTIEDAGCYNLKIRSRKGDTNWTYRVIITYKPREKSPVKGNNDKPREKSPVKGNNGKRVDESAVEIPLLDK